MHVYLQTFQTLDVPHSFFSIPNPQSILLVPSMRAGALQLRGLICAVRMDCRPSVRASNQLQSWHDAVLFVIFSLFLSFWKYSHFCLPFFRLFLVLVPNRAPVLPRTECPFAQQPVEPGHVYAATLLRWFRVP